MVSKEKIIFTKDECSNIINYCESNLKSKAVSTSKRSKYQFFQIEYNDETNWIFDRININFTELTNIKIKDTKRDGLLVLVYNVGDMFGKHTDRTPDTMDKMWNTGVLLNEDFEGGEYNYYNNGWKTFEKQTGNFMVYESDITHEITMVTKGKRYAIVKMFVVSDLEYTKTKMI